MAPPRNTLKVVSRMIGGAPSPNSIGTIEIGVVVDVDVARRHGAAVDELDLRLARKKAMSRVAEPPICGSSAPRAIMRLTQTDEYAGPQRVERDQHGGQRQAEIKRGEADEIAGAARRLQRLEQHVFVDRDGDIAQRKPYQVERDEKKEQAEFGGPRASSRRRPSP